MRTLAIGKVNARAKAQVYNTQASSAGDSTRDYVPAATVVTDTFAVYPAADATDPTGARYVGTASQWDMDKSYRPGFWDIPGLAPDPQTILHTAPGSGNLSAPRDSGGIPGTNRLVRSVGPVTNQASEWTGGHTSVPSIMVGASGPVGYSDYSAQLAASFAAANRQIFDQAIASAQLVAAV